MLICIALRKFCWQFGCIDHECVLTITKPVVVKLGNNKRGLTIQVNMNDHETIFYVLVTDCGVGFFLNEPSMRYSIFYNRWLTCSACFARPRGCTITVISSLIIDAGSRILTRRLRTVIDRHGAVRTREPLITATGSASANLLYTFTITWACIWPAFCYIYQYSTIQYNKIRYNTIHGNNYIYI